MTNPDLYAQTPAGFAAIRIDSIDDLMRFIRKLQDPRRFIYRGQSNAAWGLETRVERGVPDGYKHTIGLPKSEQDILGRFSRRAHHYLRSEDIPKDDAVLEWLALIQHYGGPTRLLDFTRSIFIGAYFAVGTLNLNDQAAIWCVNWDYMEQNFRHKEVEHENEIDVARKHKWGETTVPPPPTEWITLAIYHGLAFPAALTVEPFRQNRRLLQQQGLFVAPLNINRPFADNLSEMFQPKPDLADHQRGGITLDDADKLDDYAVIKLVIHKPHYPHFQAELRRMNIATETLFPDLDGEARALDDIRTEHIFVEDVL